MRPHVLSSILLSAAFVVGCGVDNIQAPSPSARLPLLERGATRSETAFDYTTIDVPNAVFTSASGINPRGDIVGSYIDGSGRSHGYLLRDGEFTTIDFPGSAGTEARGISPNGEIVGDYWWAGEPAVNIHGYVRTKQGSFVPVNDPPHTNTIIQRILPDGTMLGCRHDGDLMMTMRGIIVGREGYAELDQFASMENGGTPDGRLVVGLYTNMAGKQQGFLIDDGVFKPLFVGDVPTTAAWDMNPAGEIVGVYRNSAGVHGFVQRADGYSSIDVPVPGTSATRAFGINPRGDVVGTYVASGVVHGFLASR